MHNHATEVTIGLSFLLGSLHSLEPGHGKTAMFLYLVGGRRSVWHPLVMGLSTALAHSVSLFVIASAVFLAHHLVTGEHQHEELISSALQWISAGLVVAAGAYLLVQACRGTVAKCCAHDHAAPDHECTNEKRQSANDQLVSLTLAPAQSTTQCGAQAPRLSPPLEGAGGVSAKQIHPTNQPQNSSATDPQGGFKTTALLGLAVGLLPCPSALAAYFAGLSSGSPLTAYGIILLFAAGMAFSLTIAGILLQHFGDRLGSRLQQSSKLPWAHLRAVLILGIGAFNLARLGMA